MNGFISRLKSDKKLLSWVLLLGVLTVAMPYFMVPLLLVIWFFKSSKISNKTKVVTAWSVGGFFALVIGGSTYAYVQDEAPTLTVTNPESSTITIKAKEVVISGSYTPKDRSVWINKEKIESRDGEFEHKFALKEGENKIVIEAGMFKRASQELTITRELTEEELAARKKSASDNKSNLAKQAKPSPTPSSKPAPSYTSAKVVKVVDGDTVDVDINGKTERLRLIGLDTPETVDPRKPVQCYGVEASNKAKELLGGKNVKLEADPSQGERDKYDRLLRYIYLPDGQLFNKLMIAEGYAFEYTFNIPYKYQSDFQQAELDARNSSRGLWTSSACNGEAKPVSTPTPAAKPVSTPQPIVNTNPPANSGCDPNYSGCVPIVSHDLNCPDIGFYVQVLGYDKHGFDRDKDGFGCESYR